jgi:hypothetical protein
MYYFATRKGTRRRESTDGCLTNSKKASHIVIGSFSDRVSIDSFHFITVCSYPRCPSLLLTRFDRLSYAVCPLTQVFINILVFQKPQRDYPQQRNLSKYRREPFRPSKKCLGEARTSMHQHQHHPKSSTTFLLFFLRS